MRLILLFSLLVTVSFTRNLPLPIQKKLSKPMPFLYKEDYIITKVAKYDIKALILSKKKYWWFRSFGSIMPYDFALGWDIMSNPNFIKKIKVSQGNRWYQVTYPYGYDHQKIMKSSANVHLVPANKEVLLKLQDYKKGDRIHLKGHLINIDYLTDRIQRKTKTSLTRNDTGAGACEILWVESATYLSDFY